MAVLFRIFFMTIFSISILMMLSLIIASFGRREDFFTSSLKKLKDLIASKVDDLIPIDIQELKILAWTTTDQKTKKNVTSGYLKTIFQEKLISYAIIRQDKEEVLYAETTKASYTLHKNDRSTKVFLSDKQLGTITAYKGFYELETDKEFYKAIHEGGNTYSLREKDVELADIYLGGEDYSNDRLFRMIHKDGAVDNEAFVSFLLFLILLK